MIHKEVLFRETYKRVIPTKAVWEKTAASVNLAYASALSGNRTLLCDLDPQGASGFYFRVKPSEKLKSNTLF